MAIAKKINLSLEDLQAEINIDSIISDVDKPVCREFSMKFKYKFCTETGKDSPQFRVSTFLSVICDFDLSHKCENQSRYAMPLYYCGEAINSDVVDDLDIEIIESLIKKQQTQNCYQNSTM